MTTGLDAVSFIARYREAFATFEAGRIASFYTTPSFALSKHECRTFHDDAALREHLSRVTAEYRKAGVTALRCELGATHSITAGLIEIPVCWTVISGSSTSTLNVAYVARCADEDWKIRIVYGLD